MRHTCAMLLVACATVCGCGSSGSNSSGGGGTKSTTPSYMASAHHAYVCAGKVYAYTVSSTGAWTANGSVSADCQSMAIDPMHRFLYAVAGSSGSVNEIWMFTINTQTGALTPTNPASVIVPGQFTQSIAVDGLGKYAYTANTDTNDVTALVINQTTGVLTPAHVPTIAAVDAPNGVTTDSSGKYVYVSNKLDGIISQYLIDSATGSLSANNPATSDGGPGPFAGTINPAGTVYYSPGQEGNAVEVMSIDAANGTLLDAGRIATGNGPVSVALTPNGKFAYVAIRTDSRVGVFSVSESDGTLTQIGSVVIASGTATVIGSESANYVAVDPGGQILYVGCGTQVSIFGINTDGTLTYVSAVPQGAVQVELTP
jgi:6-phosphogluconolactonase (cycloisomerase 2 family)